MRNRCFRRMFFLRFYTELKNLPSLLFLSTNITLMDIADPNSMQDTCHMNFVIDLAYRGVSVAQWSEHRSAEIRRSAVRFVMGLRIFSFSHALDKTKTSLAQFVIKSL